MAHVKSLDDLRKEEDPDSRDMNDFYAGGKSGQIIRGPPDEEEEDEEGDKISSLFDKARRSGAVQGTAEDLGQPSSSAFRGQGRTLAGGPPQAPPPRPQGPVVHVITFYRNGIFTVSNGPPRRVDDPANLDFIASISKGECPKELEPTVPGTDISVNLVRKEEDYEEPAKPRTIAFQGTGQTLGGAGTATSSAAAPASSSTEWGGVDDSQPVTSLQLRLADGQRMVARFNHTHRVSDIRRFIRASRPNENFPYALMSGVPPQPITGEDRTLAEAGLLNAVIIQRK